jgi:hypothetical protein
LTKEHFVPRCLWAGPRPDGIRTVPVHKQCNKQFSEHDEYFRNVLVCWARGGAHPELLKLLEGPMSRCFNDMPGVFRRLFRY